jgi:hypothetical protein
LSSNAVLLFLQLFAGHFDTSVGPKVESASYVNVVKKLECRSEDILFLTDVPRGKKTWQYSDFKRAVQFTFPLENLTAVLSFNILLRFSLPLCYP